MADESKALQSPESSQPEVSGSSPVPSAAGSSPSSPAKPAAPPSPRVPLDNELSRRYLERFADAILDALEHRKQSILIVDCAQLLEIACYSRDEQKFDLLEDYTALDWPRREKRFDLVAQLYSFTHNTRIRPPSFVNLQSLDKMIRGHLVTDVVAIVGRLDIVLGEVDR